MRALLADGGELHIPDDMLPPDELDRLLAGLNAIRPLPPSEAFARLRQPFPPEVVGKLPRYSGPKNAERKKGDCRECGKYHDLPSIHLDYVGHAAVTDRLLEVDPAWTWEPLAFDETGLPVFDWANDRPVGLWIRLTVLGVTRLGYGSVETSKGDPEKQLISDAIRNAAMRFGVALDLWSKEELPGGHVEREPDEKKPTAPPADAADEMIDAEVAWELQARIATLPPEVQNLLRERWKETDSLRGRRIDRLPARCRKHAEALVEAFEKVARNEHDWKRQKNWRKAFDAELAPMVASCLRGVVEKPPESAPTGQEAGSSAPEGESPPADESGAPEPQERSA